MPNLITVNIGNSKTFLEGNNEIQELDVDITLNGSAKRIVQGLCNIESRNKATLDAHYSINSLPRIVCNPSAPTTKTLTFKSFGNRSLEAGGVFTAKLGTLINVILGTTTSATVTILNNEQLSTVLTNSSTSASEAGTPRLLVLSRANNQALPALVNLMFTGDSTTVNAEPRFNSS